MTSEYQFKKLQLINYLKLYLSKKLNMNIIFIIIINKLKNNHKITLNQYNSIIKFIEREPKLINRDRDYIFNYFSPLIHNIEKESYEPNTLCKFIQ
jgi:hypothetical protein